MLRKNVSGQFVYIQGIDATSGGIKSGLTWTMRRCLDGTFAAGGATISEDSTNGWYKVALTQGDTNGNNIGYNFTASGAVPVTLNVIATAADPTDGVRLGLTALPNAAASAVGGLPVAVDTSGRVDVLKINGTSQTARDIGASVLLSSGTGTGQVSLSSGAVIIQAGTGTGQLDFTSGVVKANLAQILGTALTETAGQIAAAFKKFFNIATPASTMDALTLVATATNLTNAPTSGDFTSTMKTSIGTAVAASAVASVTGNIGGNVAGSVGSVAGNVSGSVASVVGNVTVGANNDKTGYALTGAQSISSLAISGNVTLGNLTNNGTTTLTGAISTGALTVASQTVTGNLTMGNLSVSGSTTLTGAVTATNGSNSITGVTAAVTGNVTLAASQGNISMNVTGNLSGSVGSVSGAVGSVTGNVGGNITGSIGSISGITFPTNFSALSITSGGAVTAGTVSDKTGYALTGAYDAAKTAAQAGDEMDLVGAPNATAVAAIQSGLSTLDASSVTTAVWDAAQSGHTGTGSFGSFLDVKVSTVGGGSITVQDIVDGVWDEAIASHADSGSTGAALAAAQSAGDPWATALPGSYTTGQAGKIVGDNLNATVGSRSSHSATDIWAVTTRLLSAGTNIVLAKGTGITGFNDLDASGVRAAVGLASANLDTQLATIAGYIDTEVAAIKAKTDNLPSDPADASDIAAAFSSLQSHGDSTWSTATGFSTLDAAGVRGAVGLASANLDTQLGNAYSRLGAPAGASIAADIASVYSRLGAPAGASMAADIAAVLAKWTTAMTESYAAQGDPVSPVQALHMILQSLHEFSITGTTRTVKKLNGAVTAMTFTLDDADAPTSTTRAT